MQIETVTRSTVHAVPLAGVGDVPVRVDERGEGRPVLMLHGGAGPASVGGFADLLAASGPARVLTPAHPGFDLTPRPGALTAIRQLGRLYAGLLEELDLTAVTVVGNSIGGWIAAELALLHPVRVDRVVLVDAVGIEVPGHPVADFFSLTFPELARLSYADPARFTIDPSALPEAARTAMAGNRAALAVYGGSMVDPTLRDRLSGVDLPTLVVWGEADRIADPDYGRAFAAAIPGAGFLELPATGHLPQIETPGRLLEVLQEFASRPAGPGGAGEWPGL